MQDLRGIRNHNQETEGRLFSQAQSHLQTKEYGHGGHVNQTTKPGTTNVSTTMGNHFPARH